MIQTRLPISARRANQTFIVARLGADLFGEAMLAILSPSTRTLGGVYLEQLRGAIMGAPLPMSESIMIAWPQTVGLIASTIVLYVDGYILFQRQEVRA